MKKYLINLDVVAFTKDCDDLNNKGLSEKYGIPHRRVGEIQKHLGISTPRKGYLLFKNSDFFDEIDSELKAYLLGHLLADGCVSIEAKRKNGEIYSYNKRIAYTVTRADESILELIQSNICPNNSIKRVHTTKGSPNRKPQSTLKFSDSKIVELLISKYSILPRKTYDINFEFDFNLIPENFHRDFLRGFLDGDGWITVNPKRDFRSINFVSTSKKFVNQIGGLFVKNVANCKYGISEYQCKNMKTYNLRIHRPTRDIWIDTVKFLYENASFYLDRKFIKTGLSDTVRTNKISQGLLAS